MFYSVLINMAADAKLSYYRMQHLWWLPKNSFCPLYLDIFRIDQNILFHAYNHIVKELYLFLIIHCNM
jgi:hypothetical protein